MEEAFLQISLKSFEYTRNATMIFILGSFMVRVVYGNLTGNSQNAHFSAIKDVALYFILIFSYKEILETLFLIPGAITPGAYQGSSVVLLNETGDVPRVLWWTIESIIAILYYLGIFIHGILMVALSALGPLIFLLSTQFRIGIGLQTFFSILILASAWPFVWYSFDQLSRSQVMQNQTGLSALVFELLIQALKVFVPIGIGKMAMDASPAGKAVKSVGSVAKSATQFVAMKTFGPMMAAKGKRDFRVPTPRLSSEGQQTSRRRGERAKHNYYRT